MPICNIMRKSFLSVFLFLFWFGFSIGQKPVALKTVAHFRDKHPFTADLFNPPADSKNRFSNQLTSSFSMSLRPEVFSHIHKEKPFLLRLSLPAPFNTQLDLYQTSIFSSGAKITTSDGTVLTPNPKHLYYRGIIQGDLNSIAIVSIFEDRIQILFADRNGNKRIQQTHDGNYIAFEDIDIRIPKQTNCHVQEDEHLVPDIPGIVSGRSMTGNCVEVYVECDHESYLDNGSSVSNTEEWVGELWNEVITLYENEEIPVAVSDIHIYTSPFPVYDTLNSTGALLDAFVEQVNSISYAGRLAHLMSTRNLGGGIAYINVLCSNTNMCAVSASLTTNIIPFPTYSWNVEVVTHEMGHNMGSRHTHACAWNGNNTQIDDCGNQYAEDNGLQIEGFNCYNPNAPILPPSGTIMSYCHLVSGVGINFTNGFGAQPGNLIRDRYNNASCNTGTCSTPECTMLTSPLPNSINIDITADLTWSPSPGAVGYKLTIGTTPSGTEILNNVDIGLTTTYDPVNPFPYFTTIYVKITPYNALGDALCSYQAFTTEPNIPPMCTQLTYPLGGSSNIPLSANLEWSHSVGNQLGYKLTVGTSPNNGSIINNQDVGNVTFYDLPGYLPPNATIYVKITPYGSTGDVPCTAQSFTTQTPVDGDFCNMAINLACGAIITGNTSQAYPDQEAFTCGTTIEAPGLWYTFTGNGQNTIISTCTQSGYDVKMNAYSGNCTSLTCVSGIDDFCGTASYLSFPTVSGTTYYILIQGWDGQVGSFTLTRECYDGIFYCQSSGLYTNFEWIKTFSFAGFTKSSGRASYNDFTDDTITIARGGSYSLQISPMFGQSPRNEYYRMWADYNHDGDFSDSGEQIFSTGPSTTTVNGTIAIPITASTGPTRLRVSMRNNQLPASCNSFTYGEVEDYTLDIRCNMVTSTSDSGNGSLRSVSGCADDGEHILFAPALNGQIINVTAGPIVSDGIWKWMANPNSNIQIRASGITRVLTIPLNRSVEIQNLDILGGTATTGSAIDNSGTLVLRNTDLLNPAGSNSITLKNTGSVTIEGNCDIRQ